MSHNPYKFMSPNRQPLYVNSSPFYGNHSSGSISDTTDTERSADLEKESLQASIRVLHKEVEQLREITSEQDERIRELALALDEIRRVQTRQRHPSAPSYWQEC